MLKDPIMAKAEKRQPVVDIIDSVIGAAAALDSGLAELGLTNWATQLHGVLCRQATVPKLQPTASIAHHLTPCAMANQMVRIVRWTNKTICRVEGTRLSVRAQRGSRCW